jgi:hypothetical protein
MFPVKQLAQELATTGNMPQMLEVEKYMAARGGAEGALEMPVAHYFINGVYVRALTIPKGSILTGVIHKQEKVSILASGKLRIADQNSSPVIIEAPYIVVDPPGIKRIFLALEESVFINVFHTYIRKEEGIMEHLGAKSCEEYAEFLMRGNN